MVLGGILIASWGGFKKRMNTTMDAGAIYGLIMIGLGNAGVFLLYLLLNTAIGVVSPCYNAVSYTHLDVYKRQDHGGFKDGSDGRLYY